MAVKGGTTSEETKAKQSAAAYRRWGVTEEDLRIRAAKPPYDRTKQVVSEETRLKISRATKGRRCSPETIALMREAAYRRLGITAEDLRLRALIPKNPKGFQKGNQLGQVNKGRIRESPPPERRAKISQAMQRRKTELGYICESCHKTTPSYLKGKGRKAA